MELIGRLRVAAGQAEKGEARARPRMAWWATKLGRCGTKPTWETGHMGKSGGGEAVGLHGRPGGGEEKTGPGDGEQAD